MPQTKTPRPDTTSSGAPRLTGEPFMRIVCATSDALVGYLYQWNNGDLQPAWLHDPVAEVRYEPLLEVA